MLAFHTKRLEMYELSALDLADVHQLHSRPETDRYNTLGIPESIQTTEQRLTGWLSQQAASPRPAYIFSIKLKGTTQFVGLIALIIGKPGFNMAEVWYKVHPAYWRQGYATEALSGMLAYGLVTLTLHRIEAGCAVDNLASSRVLEKAGMVREGRKQNVLPIRGDWVDSSFYSILATEFKH